MYSSVTMFLKNRLNHISKPMKMKKLDLTRALDSQPISGKTKGAGAHEALG
jgi:hypothetical protein